MRHPVRQRATLLHRVACVRTREADSRRMGREMTCLRGMDSAQRSHTSRGRHGKAGTRNRRLGALANEDWGVRDDE